MYTQFNESRYIMRQAANYHKKRNSMSRFTDFLKNCFYLLMFLILLPELIHIISKHYTTLMTPSTKVGILSFNHPLTSSGEYIKNLKKFFKDPSIKAILLRMDCPGGAAGTSQAIYSELAFLKKMHPDKPVVVFVENMCASGGYYIASTCDWIVATGSSFVGSIGVYIALPRLKEFINQFKIEYTATKTGKYKTALNPLLPPVEGEQDLMQELCDDTYQQFIQDVAQARPVLNLQDADTWANGKIFTGRQALDMKLVDELGSLSHAEQKIREKAFIPATQEIQWIKAEQKNIIMKLLSPDDTGESNDDISLSGILGNIFSNWLLQHARLYS